MIVATLGDGAVTGLVGGDVGSFSDWHRSVGLHIISGSIVLTNVDNEPSIRDLNVPGPAFAVTSAENAAAEDLPVKISRSVNVGDRDEMCDGEPLARGISS